ncbi:M4 family metallopeptidase [Actinocorallia longicatena]|uniref:Neutral metalloproteinase n=1 Tax=Actinocorallia longicatena TaxID=111803 RepID=A0ABP6QK77_9ACTN
MRKRATVTTAVLAAAAVTTPLAAPAASAAPKDELQVIAVAEDRDGTTHTRLARIFDGLPVLGGDQIEHRSPGGRKAVSRTIADAPRRTARKIGSDAAAGIAGSSGGGQADPGSGRLVYEARTADHRPRLAWRWLVGGLKPDGTPSRSWVSIDAATGKILLSEETIMTETGDGASLYGGTVPLETTKSGSTFQLKDASRGGTYTGDSANQTDFCLWIFCFWRAPSTVFTDADNHWGTGATADKATVAVDAQYGTAVTWDFYKTFFGRNGIKNDGKGSYNRVHYGSGYANAFWDDSCFCMTYGDGDGTKLGPLTSLDVAGHEMSHGVTSATANLTYSGESGGLNEATSDIFGSSVEFFAGNAADPGDYLIGEKVVRPGFGGTALRYMDRPSRDGRSPDYWSSSLAGLDVHYSSGVANHFFYLLAEGSGAKTISGVAYDSPTFDGAAVTGIGRDQAVRIWYRALTTYMTSGTSYAAARTATLNAARDLYGDGSAQQQAVAAAWKAVNVK